MLEDGTIAARIRSMVELDRAGQHVENVRIAMRSRSTGRTDL